MNQINNIISDTDRLNLILAQIKSLTIDDLREGFIVTHELEPCGKQYIEREDIDRVILRGREKEKVKNVAELNDLIKIRDESNKKILELQIKVGEQYK